MDKLKKLIIKNKKIVIPVVIVVLLLFAVGIYVIVQLGTNPREQVNSQTGETVEVSSTESTPEDLSSEAGVAQGEESKADQQVTSDNPSSESSAQNNTSSNAGSSGNNGNAGGSSNSGSTGGNTGSAGSNAGSGNSGSSGSKPTHTHVWKAHTAQKWVSNMVTVPDYEEQKVAVGNTYIFAYDGYTTTSLDDAKSHARELILAGLPDNYRTEAIYETQKVQVGSHPEDHGHYETYTDYYYCDCGARK